MAPIAPALMLAAQIGIPLARQYFGSKDEEKAARKAAEENRRRQAMSNLINALSPRARHQPLIVDPELRASGISQALGAAQKGLTAFNLYQGLKGQAVEGELARNKLEQQKGAARFAQEDLASKATPGGGGGDLNRPPPKMAGVPGAGQFQEAPLLLEPPQGAEVKAPRVPFENEFRALGFFKAKRGAETGDLQNRLLQAKVFDLENPEVEGPDEFELAAHAMMKTPDEVRRLPDALQAKLIPKMILIIADNPGLGIEVSDISGKEMPPKLREKMEAMAALQTQLVGTRNLFEQNKDVLGKDIAVLPDARRRVDLLEQARSDLIVTLRNAVETGVMTDPDFDRTSKQLPDKWDSWTFAEKSFQRVISQIFNRGKTLSAATRREFYVPPEFRFKTSLERAKQERERRQL